MTFDGLDQRGLAAALIDREHRHVVLAAVENLLTLERDLVLVAVGEINEATTRVHVDRSRALTGLDRGRIRQSVLDEHRIALERALRLKLVGVELVLPLDRDIGPWLRGMKIEMPWAEAKSGSRRDRGEVGQCAAIEREDF